MEWLLHNPIADMYGPVFVILYGYVIGITYTFCRHTLQDKTLNLELPLVPKHPDPYQLAYLRSGENEVIHVAIFKLIKNGYLQINENQIQQVLDHPEVVNLSFLESVVFKWFSFPRKADFTFDLGLQNAVQSHCDTYQQFLKSEQLLYPKVTFKTKIKSSLIGLIIVLSFGGYKLLIASMKGLNNVAFLYVMSFVAIILFASLLFQMPPRLSNRGERYLTRLQNTFSQLKKTIQSDSQTVEDYLLLLALFGVEELYEMPNDPYSQLLFPPSPVGTTARSKSSNGGCAGGSSCSSGSCSHSSCGGGCGGGCGGCGGGCGGCGG